MTVGETVPASSTFLSRHSAVVSLIPFASGCPYPFQHKLISFTFVPINEITMSLRLNLLRSAWSSPSSRIRVISTTSPRRAEHGEHHAPPADDSTYNTRECTSPSHDISLRLIS